MEFRHLAIHLAENEWVSNCPPHEVAAEYFAADDSPETLVVEVIEHAGWWVLFAFHEGRPLSLGSASCASQNPAAVGWRARNRNATYRYVPSVWRQSA